MSHYAKIENGLVVQVNVIQDDYFNLNRETRYVGKWVKTSYNTHGGVHYNLETNEPSEDQSKSLRKNYAGIGYAYDEERDAFIPPKPFDSWILDEETCLWNPPVPRPSEGTWNWNEEKLEWEEVSIDLS
jgi:hypothetical protein